VDWFRVSKSEADRLSAAVEAFENFICAIEQLQMILHTLNMMTRNPGAPFFLLYFEMNAKEGRDPKSTQWRSTSAGALLQSLHRTGWQEFQQHFGLPSFGDIHSRHKELQEISTERQYRAYLLQLRDRIRQALRNRRTPRIIHAYNKVKHGAVILRVTGTESVLMVHALRRRSASSCRATALPYKATLSTVQKFSTLTQTVSDLASELLLLRFGPFSKP
jgi:hypothetical protein